VSWLKKIVIKGWSSVTAHRFPGSEAWAGVAVRACTASMPLPKILDDLQRADVLSGDRAASNSLAAVGPEHAWLALGESVLLEASLATRRPPKRPETAMKAATSLHCVILRRHQQVETPTLKDQSLDNMGGIPIESNKQTAKKSPRSHGSCNEARRMKAASSPHTILAGFCQPKGLSDEMVPVSIDECPFWK
jgi:hypothetical protein